MSDDQALNGARTMALVVGVLVGTFIGIGIGIGNAARKRMDRWSPCYLCLLPDRRCCSIAKRSPAGG